MLTPQKIRATALERQYIARHIAEAQATEAIAKEIFTMFCEGHGISGATFVGIDGDAVVVTVPETKPELVQEAAEA